MKKCLCFITFFCNWATDTPVSKIWYCYMNSHFSLYLQFPFSLQDKELLYYSSPHVGIATLGCFPSRKAYFDSWQSPDITNNLEAREFYTPSKAKRSTKADPCVHTGANHSTFHCHCFSSSSKFPCMSGSAWERQCSQRCDIQLGGTGGTHEQFQRLGTPRAPPVAAPDSEGLWMLDLGIFLLTISELCNGEVKGMPISFERNRGSERKLFALEDIVATTLERMEPNNTDWSELMTKDPVLTVVHPGCTLCQSHHLALSPCNFFVACCKIHAKLIHLRWWHVPVPNKSSYVTEHKEHVF